MTASVMVGYLRTTRADNGDLLPHAPNMINAAGLIKQTGITVSCPSIKLVMLQALQPSR